MVKPEPMRRPPERTPPSGPRLRRRKLPGALVIQPEVQTWRPDFDRAGLPPTLARVETYRLLKALDGTAIQAGQLFRDLCVAGHSIPLSSVYPALRDLVNHGLVSRIEPAGGKATYRLARQGRNATYGAVCRLCGRRTRLRAGDWLTALATTMQAHRVGLSIEQVLIHGVCDDCATMAEPGAQADAAATAGAAQDSREA